MNKIAVTGSLGAGKSTVCDILKSFGAYVVNTDDLAHEILLNDKTCAQQVIDLLGPQILVDGLIDRKKVADLVFSDKEKLLSLEKILHPLVFNKMKQHFEDACASKDSKFFVAEVPLLYESGWDFFFDKIIVITCAETLAIQRAQTKGISRVQYQKRTSRLLSVEEKKRRADHVLINDGSAQSLREKVYSIIEEIST